MGGGGEGMGYPGTAGVVPRLKKKGLLQDELIAETGHFITGSLFTRWLWGKCEDEGASPRVGFPGACGINRRVV